MSTKFIYNDYKSKKQNKNIVGLFYWGSKGLKIYNINNLNIPTLVIHGNLDGIIKMKALHESLVYLPKNSTTVKIIEGGNHSYFGDFPVASFYCLCDNEATLTRDEQINITFHEMLQFLNNF